MASALKMIYKLYLHLVIYWYRILCMVQQETWCQCHPSNLHCCHTYCCCCCSLEAVLSAVKLREGRAGLEVTAVSLSTVTWHVFMSKQTEPPAHLEPVERATVGCPVSHRACVWQSPAEKFPKQTYLCPIQGDQRLVVCHNSLSGGWLRCPANLPQFISQLVVNINWRFMDEVPLLWRSGGAGYLTFTLAFPRAVLRQVTRCCAEARGPRVGVSSAQHLCWFLYMAANFMLLSLTRFSSDAYLIYRACKAIPSNKADHTHLFTC